MTMEDSNHSSYSDGSDDCDDQYGHGEGFDLPSPWEDRMFWETRAANQNHFYRTSSTFTSSSADAPEDAEANGNDNELKADKAKGVTDDKEYQVMVIRGEDGKYQVRTNAENMDDEVMEMLSPSSEDSSNDKSLSVFRPDEGKSKTITNDAPPLVLSSTNSSEWSKESDDDECAEKTKNELSSIIASSLPIVMIVVAAIGYVVATIEADGTKIIEGSTQKFEFVSEYPDVLPQEQDTAVTEFEEYCRKAPSEALLGLIIQLVENFANLYVWRERAEGLLSGALPTNWISW